MRSLFDSPSIPTHVDEACSTVAGWTVGTVHEAEAAVNVVPDSASPAQLVDVSPCAVELTSALLAMPTSARRKVRWPTLAPSGTAPQGTDRPAAGELELPAPNTRLARLRCTASAGAPPEAFRAEAERRGPSAAAFPVWPVTSVATPSAIIAVATTSTAKARVVRIPPA